MTKFQGIKTVADAYTLAVSDILARNIRKRKRFQGMNIFRGKGRAKSVQHRFQMILLILFEVV
jgi:ribosomal protein L22